MIRDELPRNSLIASDLRGFIALQRVQQYWFMWSLSDEELREFFDISEQVSNATGHFIPSEMPTSLTVAGAAAAVFEISKHGVRGAANNAARALSSSAMVEAVAAKFPATANIARALGYAAIPSFLVIGGLNIMARNNSSRAKRELAARNLLVYKDL